MPVARDDHVVMDRDAERGGDGDDIQRRLDVGGGGRRIARGMVVDEDDRRGREFERTAHHFARIDRRVIDSAGALTFVGDQSVALVEKEDVKLFVIGKRNRGAAIVDERAPRTDLQAFSDRALGESFRAGLEDLELGDRRRALISDFKGLG